MLQQSNLQQHIGNQRKTGTFCRLDWISVTYLNEGVERWGQYVHPSEHAHEFVETKARNGYTTATRYKSGAILQHNPERKELGINVTYPSSAIDYITENEQVSSFRLLQWLTKRARPSRIDIALDCIGMGIDIAKLHDDVVQGNVRTLSRAYGYIQGGKIGKPEVGRTLYVGSPKKRTKLLRVYDKGEQLGIKLDLKRFELESRQGNAIQVCNAILGGLEPNMHTTIAGLIKGYCEWSCPLLKEAFEAVKPERLPKHDSEKDSNTVKWLLDSCAVTLAKESITNPEIIAEFYRKVIEVREGLQSWGV